VHTVDQENVSATLTVAVPAARVFALLADPTTYSAIDGTGSVQEVVDRAPLTEVGQIFRMDMYHVNLEFGGWMRRYDLAALGPSETQATLTYDWSAVPQFIREYIQSRHSAPEYLTNSLHRLAELAAPTSRAWTPGG
jgi:hypothetical protein